MLASAMAWTGLLGILGAAPIAASAASGAVAVVAVAEPPGPDTDLARLASAFRDALAARATGVLTRDETRARLRLDRTGPTLAECDRDFAASRARINRGEVAEGIQAMRVVAGHLEEAFDAPGAFPRWSRVSLDLARAEEARGHREEGRRLMDRVLRADPSAVADPDLFPPSFVERFERARASLALVAPRRVSVATADPSARIFVEGRELGSGSATMSLAPGLYTLRVVVGGVRLPAQQLEVGSADLALTVDTALAGALRPENGPGLATPPARRAMTLAALAVWLRADSVHAVSLEGEGKQRSLVVAVHDRAAGGVTAEGRLRLAGTSPPPGGLEALAGLLVLRESTPLVELGLVSASFVAPRPAAATPAAGLSPGAAALVAIPGGSFAAGDARGVVSVSPMLIEVTEVTSAGYSACVDANACSLPGRGKHCTFAIHGKENHPINCVDWSQADAYCRWAGRRLPTEDEWEWVARGGERNLRYPWGDDVPGDRACWSGPGSDRSARGGAATCPVGIYPRGDSHHGVKDLAGNVAEWTAGAQKGGRVDRGGAWSSQNPEHLLAAHRGGREYAAFGVNAGLPGVVTVVLDAASRRADLGFRCAKSP